MMKDLKRLHSLGLALHWLRPKSKAPVEAKWTSGPRKSLDELKKTYIHGMNLGVRLGTASKLRADRFLSVIDCDVKSTRPEHLAALEEKLRELFGATIENAPVVASGRGNGSKHIYIATETPAKPARLAQSVDKVEVHMPSVKASKADTERLSTQKLDRGTRMRAAWEISLMGEGQQVVLPNSVHPDSGKPYVWVKPIKDASEIPLVAIADTKKGEEAADVADDFSPEEVFLDLEPISDRIRNMITKGEGCDDRSAGLFAAALAMCGAGLSDNAILTVLTDRENFLGSTGYDHTQSGSRKKAAEWVRKFTLKRARHETSAARDFEDHVEVEKLAPEEAEAQAKEMKEEIETLEKYNGFYRVSDKGVKSPDYSLLLEAFESERPYKTIADMKAVYVFNGTHYVDYTPIEIKNYAERRFNPKPSDKMRVEFLNKVVANNVTRRSFFISSTEGKFNFHNGVLDLEHPGRGLQPHSSEFGFRGVLPYDYDEFSMCPFFEEWLHGIMLGDEQLVKILQEFMGYVVRGGEYKYHKALWLGGAGRNGKSTFVDILKALIGVGNYSVLSIKALMNDRFAGSELDGKIANFSEETSPQELADSGPFKNLTGNGDIHAQKKFGDLYSFRSRAKVIMTYNQIPDLKDLSRGMLSRPLIIPFEKTFEEKDQDRNIQKKLLEELPGIFNFALDGWQRLERQGDFTFSTRSQLALRKVKEESCNVYQWVENSLKPVNGTIDEDDAVDTFTAKELYDQYRREEKYAFKMVEFCRRLNGHPLIPKHKRKTNRGAEYFGLRFV